MQSLSSRLNEQRKRQSTFQRLARRADHDIADRYRGCVRGSVAHSAAHVRVKREADGSQKHLALDRDRDGLCLEPEIVGSRRSEWS